MHLQIASTEYTSLRKWDQAILFNTHDLEKTMLAGPKEQKILDLISHWPDSL